MTMEAELSRRSALLAAGAVITGSSVPAQETAARVAESVPDFAGKTLVVYVRNRPLEYPDVLGNCRLESQNGRVFLVGTQQTCLRNLPSWTDGIRCSIAWESIDSYMVFDSLSAFHDCRDLPYPEESLAERGNGL
jgi:hypothetical protein